MNELGQYQQMLRDEKMTRRDFGLRLGALGLSVTAIGHLATTAAALAQTPKRGGRGRFAWYGHDASDTLNPSLVNKTLDYVRATSVMSTLTRWDRKLEASPDIATEWEGSPDAKVWNFRIRKGVEFHNGKTLTLQDVIYSIQRHMGPKATSAVKSWFDDVASITADGDAIVRIELKAPNADLPMIFGDPHMLITPDGFTDYDRPIGTGPFKLQSFEPGVGMLAVRNERYYDSERPYLDEVETFGIGETTARINALLSGDIHFMVRVDPKAVDVIRQSPGVVLEATKASRNITIAMASDRAPMDNADLRMALKYMADRKSMLDTILKGYGQIGNDTMISPLDRYFCEEVPQREFDLDKAKFFLKKAGMEGATVELNTSEAAGGTTGPDMAVHLKESAAKAGLTINVVRQPADGYYSAIWLKKPFYMSHWNPRATADLRFSLLNLSTAKWNEGVYKDPKLDSLIIEARGTPDGPKRKELYCDIQKMVHENDGRLIPLFLDYLDARSENLKGYVPHPAFEGGGARMCDEVWLDS